MKNHPHEFSHALAFGEAFVLVMSRLTEERDLLSQATGDESEIEGARRGVAARYELEAEELIIRHHVPKAVADYVRHVVRKGFEVEFDPLDPPE